MAFIITRENRKEVLAAMNARRNLPPRDSKGRFTRRTPDCDYCGGEGVKISHGFGSIGMIERFKECPMCNGTGKGE